MRRFFLSACSVLSCSLALTAQTITYAGVAKGDVARMNFEILGKAADNYLVYKEVKGRHRISVYDYEMALREEVPITQLPQRETLLDISFYNTADRNYLLYQYQQGDIAYLKALPIEANGRILDEAILLDTTMIAYKTDNKIYSLVTSGDDNRLLTFKINKKDKSLFRFTTRLFDASLQPLGESRFAIPMEYKGDYLTGYSLTNEGHFVFVKYHRQANGNIVAASFIEKAPSAAALQEQELGLTDLFLDDIKVMVDETNARYLLSSFYSTQKRGNMEGLYVHALAKRTGQTLFEVTHRFSDDLKKRAKSRGNSSSAFNDFFINNMIVHEDGHFTIAAEALSNTSNPDRWGFWGGPGWGGFGWGTPGLWGGWGPGWGWGWNRWGGSWWPYSYYTPFFYRSYWWGGWGPGGDGYRQQFHAGNLALISFDAQGRQVWDQVIVKSQTETGTDGTISYQVVPSREQTQLLINNPGKVSQLKIINIHRDGSRGPGDPVPAKDKRMDFMPKYGKQTGEGEMIIPYLYKGNISFARVIL